MAFGLSKAHAQPSAGVASVALSARGQQTVLLSSDGSVWGLGVNANGSLGDGTTLFRSGLVRMQSVSGNLSGAGDVACGTNHTAVLMGNGTVWTVGLNSSGELGNGNTTSQRKAVQVLTASGPLTGVTALAAGAAHTLALGTSGEVWAWGSNAVGQLGNNSTLNSTRAVKVPGLTGIVAIAAGDRFSYAIKNDGTAWAFGDNANGQLGNNSTTASRIPVQVRTSAGNLTSIKAVAAGSGHGVFLTATGSVWSVGLNTSGQLGNNSTTNGLLAVPSRGATGNLSGIAEVACGDAFTLFLSTNGTISAVGSNTNGQLGDGTRVNRFLAVPVAGLSSVSFVCAGADRSFAVKTDGSVFAWGGDLYGAQGHGERGLEWSWAPLPQWSAFARASAGFWHTLWLRADGSVWAAGANLYGQLGNGLTGDSLVPVRTQSTTGNLTAIQDVAAGTAHSLALAQNGAVWAWGLNSSGRLGDGTSTTRTKAVLALDAAGPISGTSAVAVGDAFSLALRQGAVWAWGVNNRSQLGDGTTTSRSKAVPVLTASGALTGITALAAGSNHGVALKGDGTVWVWGDNYQGQLGLGNTLTQNRAVSIPGVNDALAIAAGAVQTYILRSIGGGTAWGAGLNNVGQLADGTTTARSSLVQVQSTTGALTGLAWVRAGALAHHAAAGRMDGTSWIWGQNDAGQLATGNLTIALKALALPLGIRPQAIGARFTLARRAGYEWVASGSFFDGQWGDGRKGYSATPTLVRGITFAQTPPDADGDGVPDWQEIARGSSATISDTDGDGLSDASDALPLDYFNGSTPALSITSGNNQTGVPGSRLAQPLVVSVSRNGTALANAPVAFSVTSGGLAADGNGTVLLGRLPVRTNASGQAIAYYTLPSSEGTFAILVQAGNATASVSATATWIPAVPVLSISGGTFTTQRRVVATSATPDARIHYTLDGADPNSSSPSIASGETILVDRSATLKTRAMRTSGHTSPVVSGDFKITGQVSAGAFHMGALKVDGSVWTWGNNENGQLDSAGGAKQAIPALQSGISTGRALSCGAFHTLVLLENGTVVSFGRNQEGQLGHSAASKASVSGLLGVRAIAAGGYHSLALKEDGTVWAWGANWFGQLGDGTAQSRSQAVQVLNGQGQPLGGVVAVAAGAYASYALLDNGTLWAWGGNWSGHLGDGTQANRALPVRVGTLQNVVGMAAGWNHAAAVKSDGTVWSWGDSGSGQIGGDSLYFGAVTSPVQAAGISTARAVAAGSSHTLALLSDGSLRAWGNNFSGQLGSGVSSITSSRYMPQATLFASGVASVSAGGFNTIVLRDDGSLRTFGYNEYGQMGAGDFQAKPQALASQPTGGIAGVSTGRYHSAIRFADGRAGWFGFYETGNFYIGGDDPDDQRHEARVFPNLSGVVQVVSGDNHSLALKNDGTVWAWGIGGQGQLGTGSTGTSMEPQRIPELSNVVWVSAAANSSLAVKADGTVWTWGVNDYGQLGDGGWIDRLKPAIVVGLSSIKQAEIGFKHGVAVSGSGIVSIWGNNESANLSLDAERGILPPRVVPNLVAAFVAAGDGFTVALKADGTLSSWGTNESGQLGLGDTNLRSAPTGIPNASAIVQVVAKGTFAMALKQDGTALAWGQNGLGQLGDGTFVDRPSPVSVANLDSVSELVVGAQQSFAVLRNGTLRSWGNNGNQQLGRSNANIRYPAQRLVPDAADANNNAVPDAWEIAQFGNTTTPLWEDTDGDGLNHIEEYHLGTNPKNANTDGDLFTDLADPRPLIADADASPTATLVAGSDQRILPGTTAPQPLEILLTLGGQPMANMPVIARITSGTGKLAATANATVLSDHALLVRTDAQGKARVHLQAPATEGTVAVSFDTLPSPITFQATVEIPTVTLAVAPTSVTEDGAENLVYTFTRAGATSMPLAINFAVGGNATFGTDYTATGALSINATTGLVALAANATTATVDIDPTGDPAFEPNETVVLTLAAGGNYTVGTPEPLTGTILNDDTPPPAITSALSANATVGTAFTYQIAASNNATSYSASGLPAGLTLNATSGLISGTPTAAGNATITLGATNAGGTGNATLLLRVLQAPPVITSALSANATVGTAFTYQIAASNNATSYSATGLPAGLALNATSGVISGTPTAIGNSTVTLSATNAGGTGNATLSLRVRPRPPAITSALSANATVGTAFTYQIVASNNATSYSASGLPAGLTLNATSGLISGTPTAAGNATITLGATNAGGTGNATLSLRVRPRPPAITSALTANATVGTAFTYQIAASNNATSYSATGLPAGLALNATSGLISGTPTAAGNATITLGATNAGGTGNATLSLRVRPRPPAITSALSANATVGVPFTYQIAASNNATSYSAGALPGGLTLNATSGLISGTPTAAGNSTITLGATNEGGTGNATLALRVLPPAPAITSALTANATVGTAFTYQITASNNATSYSASGLPAGLALNTTSGLISGTPTAEGTFTVGLMASNSGGSGSVSNLTLTVAHTRIVGVSGSLSFGTVGINQTATRTLTISNTGTGNLTVTGITYPSGFSGNLSGNLTVAPNTSQNVTITFTPTAPGSYAGTLAVLSNASSGNASIATSGTGVAISLPGSFSGLRLWLKADEGVSKDAAGKVSGWADQSSSGNPASQASAAKQPLWISSALNGQPVLRFDGDDFLTLGSSPSLATGNFTFFVVASTTDTWGTQALLSRDVGYNKWIYSINWSRMQMLVQNPSTSQYLESRDFARVANKAEIFSLNKAGRDYQHFLSGTRIGSQTANLDVPSINSDFRIGQAGDSYYLRGDMAEVVIYDRVLSIEERQAVENYLALKYTLPITQDSDGDGMPDGWEVANGLNPLADDTLEDQDGDRVPNIFEFQRGTLANDPASKPAATFVVNPATGGNSTTDNVYATIQEAVNKAQGIYNWETEQYEMPNAYAVIEVKAGSYAEKVTLSDVPVVLLGELGAQAGPAAILGPKGWDDTSLDIYSASVVDGFAIGKVPGRKGRGVYVRSSSRLVNCLIRGNEVDRGAAAYIDGFRLDMVHCTVFGNKGTYEGRGIYSTGTLNLINSIVWGNTGAAGQEIYKTPWGTPQIIASSSIVAGGEHGGLNLDPQLTPAGWLKSTSPAINRAGTAVVSRVDIHGEARPSGATPDLGADEYKDANGTGDGDGLPDWAEGADDNDGLSALEEYTTHGTNPLLADADNDGLNDGAEVARGTSASNPDTDLDGMPDGWEVANGLNPLADDTLEDQDGDRVPNIFEFQRGTLANDASSKPAATCVVNPATGGNSTTDNVYATIQEAVNKAREQVWNGLKGQYEWRNAYAVIEVKAGSYAEKVTLSEVPVVLLGELGSQAGPASILGRRDADDNSLEIYSASVVDGFAIGKVPGRKGRGVYVRSNSRLVNCLIRGNEVDRGAAAYIDGFRLDMVHCTVFGNKGTYEGRAIYSTGTLNLINSIVWGNTGAAGQEIYKTPWGTPQIIASSSIVAGGEHGGLNLDPQLTPAGWLKSTSPAMNRAGTAVVSRVDIHGEARPSGATPDLGADEYKDANGTGDGDGLPDWAEGAEDNDGLSALEEYSTHGTNPWIADTDNDGLNDGAEAARGTSANNPDTDGDGMPDGWEVANGLNPLADDTLEDQDGDRVPNIFEFQRGTLVNDAAAKPAATFVVNPATGGASTTDNVYATIQEAANKAREQVWNSAKGQYERPNAYAVIEVKAGSYAEKVTLNDVPVVLLGELGAQAGPPAILGRRDGDDTSLDIYSASVVDGFAIGKVPGRKGRGVYVRSNSRLVNCLIRGNEVDRGAAAYIDGFRLDMVHCTVFGNKGTYEGRGIYSTGTLNLINSIVWGNTGAAGQEIYKASGTINATTSIVAGGEHGGLNLGPQLTPAGWLKSTSPAINRAGTAVVSRVDIHGEARPSGATPDLGADEYKDANGTGDGDGLPDWAEGAEDNDGLSAMQEYTTYGTNPLKKDTDEDGSDDGEEITAGTNPLDPDTDKDGMWDGFEIKFGLNPLLKDGEADADTDGYTNLQESHVETNPLDANDKPYQIVYSRPVSNETAVSRGKVLVFGLDRPLATGISALPGFVALDSNGQPVEGTVKIMSDRKTFAFISAAPFAPGTKYRITLTKKTSGIPLALQPTVFITGEETETDPFVMTTTPMDGNINVSRAITLSSYWSEPLDETTLSASTMNLTDPAGRIVPCSLRYDSFWHRLDLIPNADLEIGTRYTVSLSTAIKDLRGETLESSPTWSFTTIGDSLPIPVSGPYVSVITPGQLLENIATTAVVEVTWSQAMNAATLNPATCKLTKAWNDEEIPTTLAYSAATARLTITPTAILAENTAYILRFTDGAQSASGLPFSQHGEWQGYFRTGIEATDGSGVPATPDPGWRNPGPGGPGIGFPPANQ